MKIDKIIATFILAVIGIIFSVDAVFLWVGNDTISNQITLWAKDNPSAYWGAVILIVAHFWLGRKKNETRISR